MTKRILVTGKNSQLGKSINKIITKPHFFFNFKKIYSEMRYKLLDYQLDDFYFASREELDLSNSKSINNFLKNQNFSVIINCAAYTKVDEAETNIDLAEKINHFAVEKLAKYAKQKNIPIIHISTDYVFGDNSRKILVETSRPSPQNVYGSTKLKGEEAIIESGCNGAIIRTSWLYSEYERNFLNTVLYLSKQNTFISVVNDQIGSPTYATNLAKLIFMLISKKQTNLILNSKLNIYHFSDEGTCSWYEFTKEIFKLSEINCEVKPVQTKHYKSFAKRPLYSVLNKDKIKNLLPEFSVVHWKESLVSCLAERKINRVETK